jgi:hypothetical protein
MMSLKILLIALLAHVYNPDKGFAVLELFTSEGCSSCPPADELFARIAQQSQGKPVYLLAYHVDYWDRQGWKDTYSSAEFSNRQLQYQQWLNGSTIYTPQVIVNGQSAFVGSQESAIQDEIRKQLAAAPAATLQLQARQDHQRLVVQYTSSVKGHRLLIAILQKSAQSIVKRGENAGHTLSHVQIVRKLQHEALNASGAGSSVVRLPDGFDAAHWEVLGLVQDQQTGKILAAAKAEIK